MGRLARLTAWATVVMATTAALLAAPAAAGPPGDPDRIAPDPRDDINVVSFELTPDSRSVAYIANLRGPDIYDLWIAPLTAPRPRR